MMRNMPYSSSNPWPASWIVPLLPGEPIGFHGFFLCHFRIGRASITPGKIQFPRFRNHPTQCPLFLCYMYHSQLTERLVSYMLLWLFKRYVYLNSLSLALSLNHLVHSLAMGGDVVNIVVLIVDFKVSYILMKLGRRQ